MKIDSRSNTARSGFTLLESLVVVAIILVLAALLFPLSKQLISKAQTPVCLQNLRQIGSAVASYGADHAGFVPPIQTDMRDEKGGVISTRWFIEINPYLPYKPINDPANPQNWIPPRGGPEKVYLCPANRLKGNRGGAFCNYTGILNASGNTFIPYATEARRKIFSFKSPSQLPYLIDGFASDNYSAISTTSVDLYTATPTVQLKVNTENPQAGIYKPVHGDTMNILFLDGHAATVDVRSFAAMTFDYKP